MADNGKSQSVSERPDLGENKDEGTGGKLSRKIKESPFMVIGLSGCVVACAAGAYKFKHRGNLSISNYLMQLRVVAQGTVIGTLTAGVVYSLYQRFTGKAQ